MGAEDETLVDLQAVQREALEVAQRAIAGAEVVQRQADAQAGEAAQVGVQFRAILHEHAFGDLQHQRLGRQSGFRQHVHHPGGETGL
ncbi:hypothetical protein D3C77_690050 [compost metagenome]